MRMFTSRTVYESHQSLCAPMMPQILRFKRREHVDVSAWVRQGMLFWRLLAVMHVCGRGLFDILSLYQHYSEQETRLPASMALHLQVYRKSSSRSIKKHMEICTNQSPGVLMFPFSQYQVSWLCGCDKTHTTQTLFHPRVVMFQLSSSVANVD
jgi:hypothetical protein